MEVAGYRPLMEISLQLRTTPAFSSRDIGVAATPDGVSLLVAPPITSDPPFHTDARRMLLPYFSPKQSRR